MKTGKKLIALLLALVMLASLAACAGGSKETTNTGKEPAKTDTKEETKTDEKKDDAAPADAAAHDILNIALATDAGTLNPILISQSTFGLLCCVYEPLWDVTVDNEIIWQLAESCEQIADNEYTLKIKQGVKFANGNPLTAEDVIFSMEITRDAGASSAPRVQTVDFEKTKIVDDYTIDLVLLAPSIAHWTILSQCVIYDKESYDAAEANSKTNGTGPYKVTNYVPNSEIILELNENYRGEAPAFKKINCKILGEDSQRVNALETGLIDIAAISTADYDYMSGVEGFNILGDYTGNYIEMKLNFGKNSAFYKNPDARRAIVHAIDRQAIANTVYLGHAVPMNSSLVSYCFDYEERFENCSETYSLGYDVELAKSLADKSGLTGQTIQIITNGTTNIIRIAEMLQGMLSQIGVNLEINNYDAATCGQMLFDVESDWELFVSTSFTPNRRCGDILLNGVRYFPTLTAEGAFENNQEYLKIAPDCMSLQDEKQLSETLYKMIKWFEDEVLAFALFDIEGFTGFADFIDMDSVVKSIGSSGIRYAELKVK